MRCCSRFTLRPESGRKLFSDFRFQVLRLNAMEHFIAVSEKSPEQLRHILDVAHALKKELKSTGKNKPILPGKTLAMLFEKPSLRTRVSFNVGMIQLGGNAIYLTREEVGIGTREPVQ